MPSLIVQPLLENAVYHGIEMLPAGGTVHITGGLVHDRIEIEVRNPDSCRSRVTANAKAIGWRWRISVSASSWPGPDALASKPARTATANSGQAHLPVAERKSGHGSGWGAVVDRNERSIRVPTPIATQRSAYEAVDCR